jgi:lysophospholipase L1-like esterase
MRLRLLAVLGAGALTLLAAVPASAESNSQGPGYLALGDSVPFGFDPLVDASNPNNFVGYPEIVAKALPLHDTNATCPGEATGGFLSLTGTDNVCRPYRAAFPLHVDYSGTQMAFALDYLRSHKRTQLVTLTLGANDFFRWQKDCAAGPLVGTCPLGIGGVLAVMKANLDTIFANIRGTGYEGMIVAVTYYSLTYPDTAGALLLAGPMIAAATAPSVHALVASGIEAWRATAMELGGGDSCAAGLLIRLTPTTCDVHPTPLGRDLLANAVVSTIAGTCSANNARLCLALAVGQGD